MAYVAYECPVWCVDERLVEDVATLVHQSQWAHKMMALVFVFRPVSPPLMGDHRIRP